MNAIAPAPRSGFDSDVLSRTGFPLISFDKLVIVEEFRSDERLLRGPFFAMTR
ncbi:MAG: hypothetical protein ACI8PT_000147 [Gammaproteobacteria bacterium]|jgi:hypothetical protein